MWAPLKTAGSVRVILLVYYFQSKTRAAERGMFADIFGILTSSLVRYIPVNQVGLGDLRCKGMSSRSYFKCPGT